MGRRLLDGWTSSGRRTWLQAATDGRWEDARGLDTPPATPEDVRTLLRVVEADDVAVEFEWLGHPLVFVGARRAPGEDDGASTGFEAAAAGLAESPPPDPSSALVRLAGGIPAAPQHIELGAANAWRSVGPLRLWSRGEEPLVGRIEALLGERPDLRSCAAPVALAIAFERPRPCWIGRELSRPDGDRHVVEAATVETQLQALFAA